MNNNLTSNQTFITALIVICAGAILLLQHSSVHGENYYYWFFSRVFIETGDFPILDRSPLSALYLVPFRLIGFPGAITVEFLFRNILVGFSLFYFLRRFLNFNLSIFGALIWLPFLDSAAPIGQTLALTSLLFAVSLRIKRENRETLVQFYALLFCAYLFRIDFLIFIMVFSAVDLGRLTIQFKSLGVSPSLLLPRKSDWPIAALVILVAWFSIAQWNNPSNNTLAQPTTWLPIENPKSLGETNFVLLLNKRAIQNAGNISSNIDIYFTHTTLLDGHKNVSDIVLNNQLLVADLINTSIADLPKAWVWMTSLPRATIFSNIIILSNFVGLLFIIWSAFSTALNTHYLKSILVPFIFASLALKAPQLLGGGESLRHFAGTVPVFLMASIYVAGGIKDFMDKARPINVMLVIFILAISGFFIFDRSLGAIIEARPFPTMPIILIMVGFIGMTSVRWGPVILFRTWKRIDITAPLLALLIFAAPYQYWGKTIFQLFTDIKTSSVKILELRSPEHSDQRKFTEIYPLIKNCHGILSENAMFMKAFMDIPFQRFYHMMEIPPFGSLESGAFGKLKPSKINCVVIATSFKEAKGGFINMADRYKNYVVPYVEQLIKQGAKRHKIKDYGEVIVLNKG